MYPQVPDREQTAASPSKCADAQPFLSCFRFLSTPATETDAHLAIEGAPGLLQTEVIVEPGIRQIPALEEQVVTPVFQAPCEAERVALVQAGGIAGADFAPRRASPADFPAKGLIICDILYNFANSDNY